MLMSPQGAVAGWVISKFALFFIGFIAVSSLIYLSLSIKYFKV
jgi:hypothetical protein